MSVLGFAARLRWAWKEWEQRTGRELEGKDVAAALARASSTGKVSESQLSAWRSGARLPELSIQVGMARFFGVDPGWLILGPASQAPPPEGYREPIPLDGGAAAARRAVEGVRRQPASAKKRRPRGA